jgi:hypothetical protein
MKGDIRCIDGRLMRHDPQTDDPDLETARGPCPECRRLTDDNECLRNALSERGGINPDPGSLLEDLLSERRSRAEWMTQAKYWEERYAQLLAVDATMEP